MSLRWDFTFDRFIPTLSSREALQLSMALAEGSSESPRLLALFGPSGTGKTHLLHAVGHAIPARTPEANVIATTARDLSVQLIDAVNRHQLAAFRRKFAEAHVILVDDLHDLVSKPVTQREFVNCFRLWIESGVRILCTCSELPMAIAHLVEGLGSIAGARCIELKRPSAGECIQILKHLAATQDVVLPPATANLVVRRCRGDIRRLVGAITRLSMISRTN